MPRSIPLPQDGREEPLLIADIEQATTLKSYWDAQYPNWCSPTRFVIHGDPKTPPRVPISPEIKPQDAHILTLLGGKN